MKVGRLVRDARLQQGLTQAELAVRAGTSQAAISELERDTNSPTIERLERVLACLGLRLRIDVEELDPWTDAAHLREFASMTPVERVAYGTASSRRLAAIVGAADRA